MLEDEETFEPPSNGARSISPSVDPSPLAAMHRDETPPVQNNVFPDQEEPDVHVSPVAGDETADGGLDVVLPSPRDVVVVEENESPPAMETGMSKSRVRRQEYGQLFAKLRRG